MGLCGPMGRARCSGLVNRDVSLSRHTIITKDEAYAETGLREMENNCKQVDHTALQNVGHQM